MTAVIKPVLCILILFSSAVIGISLSQRPVRRRDTLLDFEKLLHRAAVKIEYNAGDLCEVFSDNFADYSFRHSMPFSVQWTELIQSFSHVLTKADVRMLQEFAEGLGTADCEAQQNHIALYLKLLQEHVGSAQEDIRVKSRMYRVVPVSVGVVIALLLI